MIFWSITAIESNKNIDVDVSNAFRQTPAFQAPLQQVMTQLGEIYRIQNKYR